MVRGAEVNGNLVHRNEGKQDYLPGPAKTSALAQESEDNS
jgi:hypothetical protein